MSAPNWLKRLFCHHDNSYWIRNIYGDEINAAGGKRSWWRCHDCNKYHMKWELFDERT